MGFDEKGMHCYFQQQPRGATELERALRAVWSSCIAALRYSGRDPEILRRLAEMGMASQCDHPLEEAIEEKLFEVVMFSWSLGQDEGPKSFIRALLLEVDAEDIASEIEFELEHPDLDDLNAATGNASGRYVGPDEAAWELIREAVEPFLDDLKRRRASGRNKEAVEICKGIVLGLYRAEKNDATSWAPDAPLEIAREAVDALGRLRLSPGFAAKGTPKWAAELEGRRRPRPRPR